VADAVIPDMSVGVVDWQSDEWRDRVVSWVDDRLAGTGRVRAGPVTQPHLRPWATVLKVPTDRGSVWLKAAGPGTAFEAGLYELLDAVAPGYVLRPIATDPTRGWMLLPDGGPTLGEREAGAGPFASALVRYAELQRRLVPCADELLGRGVADMRPARMLDRFDEAVAGTAEGANAELHARIRAMRGTVAQWCERLASSALPPSLDHNDLHPWNILDGPAGARFYDWGDAVVAHPFAAMLVPLGFLGHFGIGLDDPRFAEARDAYLGVFADLAPEEDLVGTLETACRVAKVARALTWERAVRTAREEGEPLDERWAAAPLETLGSLLDTSWLGGA
jgi:hypothetical protein